MKINSIEEMCGLIRVKDLWVAKQVKDDLYNGLEVFLYQTLDDVLGDITLTVEARKLCLQQFIDKQPWIITFGALDGSNNEMIPIELDNLSGVVIFTDVWGGVEH